MENPALSTKAIKYTYNENRNKFNGIEYDSAFSFNKYEAKFRDYDPEIGRWIQIDPKPNYNESPYVTMGNNPILKADPLGDTLVNDNDKKISENVKTQVKAQKEEVKTLNGKTIMKLVSASLGLSKVSKDDVNDIKKVDNNNERVDEMNTTLENIDAIAKDPYHGYTYASSSSDDKGSVTVNSDGTIKINANNTTLRVHEIRHASMVASGAMHANIEKGKLAMPAGSMWTRDTFEANGYRAQYGFDPGSLDPDPGSMDGIDSYYPGKVLLPSGEKAYP